MSSLSETKKQLDEAFEKAWKIFKNTKRAHRIPQYKYVAKFFFVAGVEFGLKMEGEE